MPNITKKQAIHRWDKLQMILREAIFSERNADILWSVCEDQHLPENKISKIANLVGDVLMGFIHPDDLAKEIKNELALNPIIIDAIVKEVNSKIFAPIRSEINKALVLSIPTEAEIESEEAAEKEKSVVSDIIKGEVRYAKPEGVEAEPIKIVGAGEMEKVVIPKPIEMAEGPVILQKEEEFKPIMGAKKSLGELFGFLSGKEVKKEAPVAAKVEIAGISNIKTPEAPQAAAMPQPVILKDLKEVKKNDKLKEILELSKPEVNFPLDLLHIKPPSIIKSEEKIASKEKIGDEKKPVVEEIKVVHYSDLKTPLQPISDIKSEIKPSEIYKQKPASEEIKSEVKPFEIKISSVYADKFASTDKSDIKPIQEIKTEILKTEPIKEKVPKERIKVVDFTAAAASKKPEIIQDVAFKIEPINKIEPTAGTITRDSSEKIEPLTPLIEQEKKKAVPTDKQAAPTGRRGFFSFLFGRKPKENKQQEEIKKITEDKKELSKEIRGGQNPVAGAVDEEVIRLVKENNKPFHN